jgi:predicted N-acetyltransferase YhbS
MLHIRTMSALDVPLGMALKSQAGWNQTEADWQRFLELEPEGCFVAEFDGRPVGTTVTSVFDCVAWVAMVLVEAGMRGQGIGKELMVHAIRHLDQRGIPTIRLDATPLGKPLYERLGFVAEYELARWERAAGGGESHPAIRPATPDLLDAVLDLDRRATGTQRERLIHLLYRQRPDAMDVWMDGRELAGYVAFRDGSRAAQIGPAIALNEEAGRALCDQAIARCGERPVFMDIPLLNAPAMQWAEARGFAVQRRLTRMVRGEPVCDQPALLWASSGPENG